jgi:cbb3-type cytochrome oxidase subunit 3
MKYLFSNRPNTKLAHSLRLLLVVFSMLFICYVYSFLNS